MRDFTAYFILLAPLAILATDCFVWIRFGTEATITGVVRGWAEKSDWPEVVFVVGVVVLYYHLFRDFP